MAAGSAGCGARNSLIAEADGRRPTWEVPVRADAGSGRLDLAEMPGGGDIGPQPAERDAAPEQDGRGLRAQGAELKAAAVEPASRPMGSRSTPRATRVISQAVAAPPRPYQKPLYRNGRRTKASLPPTSFVTSISSRRFWMSSRIVLPTITITPEPEHAGGQQQPALKRLQDGVQPVDPCRVELHDFDRGQRRGRRRRGSADSPRSCTSARAARRWCAAAGSRSAHRSRRRSPSRGGTPSAPRPARISCASATSRRWRIRSAVRRASSADVGRLRNTVRSTARFQLPVAVCAFVTSRCRQAGSASAMPITRIVSAVASLCCASRPSEPIDVCRCRIEPGGHGCAPRS